MRTIIAGSRSATRIADVVDAIHKCGFADQITEVICGMARGADLNGKWAVENIGCLVPDGVKVRQMPADWDKYGLRAGAIRNDEMAKTADALILVWDGRSPGSSIMLWCAKKRGLKIYQHIIE